VANLRRQVDVTDDTQQWRERASGPDLPGAAAETTSADAYNAWTLHGADCERCLDGATCETGARLHQDYREARIDTPRATP
jgi:hypothetical protein